MMKDLENENTENQIDAQAARTVLRKPTTNTPPAHGAATARIFIEGLSVLTFNESDNSTQIAYVKEHHTPVKIAVLRPNCARLWIHDCNIDEKTKIEISKSNPSNETRFYQNSKTRTDDFEWMPNLAGSEWHNTSTLPLKSTAKNHLSAQLILRDATFYTRLNCVRDAVQTNINTSASRPLPRLGRVLGANIICGPGDTDILITVTTAAGSLTKNFPRSGGPYIIVVATKPTHSGSHLHLLYDHILDLPAGQPRFELRYPRREEYFNPCDIFPTFDDIDFEAESDEKKEGKYDKERVQSEKSEQAKHFRESTEFACQTYDGPGSQPPFP